MKATTRLIDMDDLHTNLALLCVQLDLVSMQADQGTSSDVTTANVSAALETAKKNFAAWQGLQ
jgi:hypothetical protein